MTKYFLALIALSFSFLHSAHHTAPTKEAEGSTQDRTNTQKLLLAAMAQIEAMDTKPDMPAKSPKKCAAMAFYDYFNNAGKTLAVIPIVKIGDWSGKIPHMKLSDFEKAKKPFFFADANNKQAIIIVFKINGSDKLHMAAIYVSRLGENESWSSIGCCLECGRNCLNFDMSLSEDNFRTLAELILKGKVTIKNKTYSHKDACFKDIEFVLTLATMAEIAVALGKELAAAALAPVHAPMHAAAQQLQAPAAAATTATSARSFVWKSHII